MYEQRDNEVKSWIFRFQFNYISKYSEILTISVDVHALLPDCVENGTIYLTLMVHSYGIN